MNPNYPNGQSPYQNTYGNQQRSSFNQTPLPGQSGFPMNPNQQNRQSGYPNQMMPQQGYPPMGGHMGQPMGQPMGGHMGQPMGQPMGGPMGQPMGGPMGGPMGQPMGYSNQMMPQQGYPPRGPPMGNSGGNFPMNNHQMSQTHMYIKNIIGKILLFCC